MKSKDLLIKFIVTLTILVSFLLLAITLHNNISVKSSGSTSEASLMYEIFYIEGMPCIRANGGMQNYDYVYNGISCDWSKWDGNK